MIPKFFTLGVYGTLETDFFKALVEHNIDVFCDIRMRRGMRGAKYAFVNSKYLQAKLASLGIKYVHLKELAPTKTIRYEQKLADKNKSIKKRERQTLSPEFIHAYENIILGNFNSSDFVSQFGNDVERVALFCVERQPTACHRSLVTKRLVRDMNVEVEHLIL